MPGGVAVDCFNYYYIMLLLYFGGKVLKEYPGYAIIVTTKILYYIRVRQKYPTPNDTSESLMNLPCLASLPTLLLVNW